VGLRIPDHALILEITRRLGKPIATTSVPPVPQLGSDELAPPSFGWQVHEHFGHALDITLDLGDELPHGESTIIDMTSEVPHLIRLGLGDPSIFADLVDARAESALTNDSEEN
jgi:tRNA A37 threonylcarbamoyladenosine synthetase subunit TsaC/SUA5/YrdC